MATLSYWICSALGIEIDKCSTLTVHGFQDSVISSLMLWQSFFSSRFRDIYFLWNNWWFLRLKFCENGEVQGMYARGLQLGGLATSKAQTWSCEGLFWTPIKMDLNHTKLPSWNARSNMILKLVLFLFWNDDLNHLDWSALRVAFFSKGSAVEGCCAAGWSGNGTSLKCAESA